MTIEEILKLALLILAVVLMLVSAFIFDPALGLFCTGAFIVFVVFVFMALVS